MQGESSSSDTTSAAASSRVAVSALVVMRLSLAGWVGAAVLFVIASVSEQMFPGFSSITRDQLATIRFPFYYAAGTACCTLALAAGVLCRSLSRRVAVALVFVVLAGAVFVLDYWIVYTPLQELIIPPGRPRTDQFHQLHAWSRNVNMLHLSLVIYAAVLTLLPLPANRQQSGQDG